MCDGVKKGKINSSCMYVKVVVMRSKVLILVDLYINEYLFVLFIYDHLLCS